MSCGSTWRKPVEDITDRAKRYRAVECGPPGPKRCQLCSSTRFLTVDHRDGDESNGVRSNLRWLCKSCNTRLGHRMARQGKGVRTRQYNPAAISLGQYVSALRIINGEMDGDIGAARQTIHDTPARQRSEYAREIWDRRGRGSDMATVRAIFGNPAKFDRCVADVVRSGSAASPYAVCQKSVGRTNPADAAADLSRAFHGREPQESVEIEEGLHEHRFLTTLGDLVKIQMRNGPLKYLNRFQGALLASNESGTQMFIRGGDQQVPVEELDGIDATKEKVNLGQVRKIVYATAKFHLGTADKTKGPYEHELGEEGGEMPDLIYDTVNKKLEFVGGTYRIDRDMEGGMSAGIRD